MLKRIRTEEIISFSSQTPSPIILSIHLPLYNAEEEECPLSE
jgi:hypothetical protein